MMTPEHPYVEERDGRWYVRESRVEVAQIAAQWREGQQPEAIAQNFAFLTPAQVYGAIAFYLDHRAEIDHHAAEDEAAFEAARAAQQAGDPQRYAELRQRLATTNVRDSAS